ncbi:MAG TPA: FKBP-type peptidyl-prolyl cis-trans isomerase [Bacteroidota bacterium]|nr:FKBP-type peptidyl-prolyl cis-trans isomerase [Bacteroidota bacterium]
MKAIVGAVFCTLLFACQTQTQNKTELKTRKDSLSYSLGLDIAKTLKQQGFDVDAAVLGQAFRDFLEDSTQMISDETAHALLVSLQQELAAKRDESIRTMGEKNKKDGDAFLAENKKKQGIVTLPSGLQYKIIVAGKGKKPTATQTVTVHYKGTFIDGIEFDNSYKKGSPATFEVNSVIPGWSEALQLMPVGSKWQIFIPAELGFGERGAGQVIPPNSTLIFEVELISIQ